MLPRIELGIEVLQTFALPLGYSTLKMERKTRFELATLALARRCSTTEPLPHKWLYWFFVLYFRLVLRSRTKRFTPNQRFEFPAYTTEPLPLINLLTLSDHLVIKVVPRGGIEPPTRGFSVLCSTDWAIWACINLQWRVLIILSQVNVVKYFFRKK